MSLFNSSELEQSVSEGLSEIKGNSDIDVSTDEIDRLRGELNELKEKHSELEGNLDTDSSKEKDNSEILDRLENLEQRIEKLEQRPEKELEIDSDDLDDDRLSKLEAKIQDAEVLRERFDSLEAELETKISQKQALEEEMGELQEQLQNKIDENEALENRMNSMESQLEEVREMAETAAVEEKVDKSRFNNKIEEFEKKFNEGHPALEQKMKEIQIEEKVDRSELHDRIDNFKDEIEELVASKTNEIEEETPDKSEVGSLWASLEMLEDKIETVDSDKPGMDEFHSKLETMEDKVQSVENEFTGLEQSIDNLEAKNIVEQESFDAQVEDLRREINTDVQELKEKMASKYATSKEVRSLWEALEALEGRQDDVEEVIAEIDKEGVSEFGRLKDTMKYLEHKVDDLDEVEQRISEVDSLNERIADVEAIIQGMDEQNVTEEEFEDLMHDVRELSEFVKELHMKVN